MEKIEIIVDKVYNLFKGDFNASYKKNNRKNKDNNFKIYNSMGCFSGG